MDYVLAAALAALVGFAEIVTRYKDEPWRAACCQAAIWFLGVNALAGLLLYILLADQNMLPAAPGVVAVNVKRVLVAGLGGSVALRSALLRARVGDQEISVGPAAVVDMFLRALDSGIDRMRAAARIKYITTHKVHVDFQTQHQSLPLLCLELLQNLPDAESVKLGEEIAALRELELTNAQKGELLLLKLLNVMGERVLAEVLRSPVTRV